MRSVRRFVVRQSRWFHRLYSLCEALLLRLRPVFLRMSPARLDRLLANVERPVKSFLFDCKMCGDCVLSSTGMSCPMNCPKRVRNGPCGGVRADGSCEVNPAMACVWTDAWAGLRQSGHQNRYLMPRRAADHAAQGHSAWSRVLFHGPARYPAAGPADPDEILYERNSPYPPNSFESVLNAGKFVVTSELSPPDSANPRDIENRARYFEGLVDAVNVPDGSGANCHMSSLASSLVLRQMGFTPIMQFACRDRNRIALQGDILGAAALGIKNLLCLTGDGVGAGDQPGAMPVFDLDSVSLLQAAKAMRDEARFMSGRALVTAPDLYLGAALNPFAPPLDLHPLRLAKKIAAGAQFVQTQYCFDVEALEAYMRAVRARSLHIQCRIIVGVGPLASAKSALWMREHVPGMNVPDSVIRRLQESRDEAQEGKRICIELVQRIAQIDGVAGVHIMAHKREKLLAEIVRESLPR